MCNAECLSELNPIKQSKCYDECGCKCNKVCLESCEGLDEDILCKLNCGCTPSKEEIVNRDKPEPVAEAKATEAKATEVKAEEVKAADVKVATNLVSATEEVEEVEQCDSKCTNTCLKTAKNKEQTVNCLVDCGCFPGFSSIELMQSPEAALIAHGSSGTFGYILLAIFLIAVIVFTGYLVVEREEKSKVRMDDVEASDNLMYQRLD